MSVIFKLIASFERRIAGLQGKGYGTGSVRAEIRAIEKLLAGKDIALCVDIGGNVGNYTAQLRTSFPEAEIFTFEPSQTNIAKLNDRFAAVAPVTIVPFALSDDAGSATLFSDQSGSGLASLSKRDLTHFGLNFDVTETVNTIRFETFWNEVLAKRPIDVLKLDIEGHELAALRGCGEALDHVRIVQFEFGGCNIDTRTYFRDFWNFFQEKGFDLFRISPFGAIPVPRYRESEEYFSTTNFLARRR